MQSLTPFLLAAPATTSTLALQTDVACKTTPGWPGWSSIKYLFTFGDSYTETGFNHSLAAPSSSNPLGNPAYPGLTSANGANWVDFLTTKYNSSLLQTYNLATGGSTVDDTLVPTFGFNSLSLRQQVNEIFLPFYAPTDKAAAALAGPAWQGNDTVFALWLGINDVVNSYYTGEEASSALNVQIFAEYAHLVMQLYEAGGRNFVFVNVPPVDRTPYIISKGNTAQEQAKKAILAFNDKIAVLAKNTTEVAVQVVNVWVLDANGLFEQVLDNPASYEATKGYTNVTEFCEAYEWGTPKNDTFNVTCGVPVNQYFWLNTLHPTSPVHEVVAAQLASLLDAGPNVCGFQSAAILGRDSGAPLCILIAFTFLTAVLLPWVYG